MKKVSLILSAALVTSMMVTSCGDDAFNEVTIGSQVWMAENLNVDKFSNGDPIPHAKTDKEWERARDNKHPAWSYYANDPANGAKYGKLYNWYAVNDPRGLAPAGWHIPSDAEWTMLTDFLGGEEVAGTKMKSTSGWKDNGVGTNESFFSGLAGDYRSYDGTFNNDVNVGYVGLWWSSTESITNDAWNRLLGSHNGSLGRHSFNKGDGLSVRCLRD